MNHQGLLYRAVDPRHWHEPLSGEGAAQEAQRFNVRRVPALYCSVRAETVLREKMQEGPLQPLLIVAIRADASHLFDARDAGALAAHGLTPDAIGQDGWREEAAREGLSSGQRLAETLRAAGHPGMVVPSYAEGATVRDVNIVFWRWGVAGGARLEVVDDAGCLPRG